MTESRELDFERCYRAVDSRDPRFDGWFYTAVTSTGIYCRPSCPAVTPKRENVRFYSSAAAAQRAGFRACRRCRPDASPGSPEWDARADVVGRAMRLIGDGVVDRDGVPGLAARLGYTERHLHRMLTAELGAGPLALARAQRAQTARILIETTDLGLAEIAFAAGFGSVRQFNDTIREVYAVAPSALRDAARKRRGSDVSTGTIALRLAYRPPLHAESLIEFLGHRAIPGVEEVAAGEYSRAMSLPHGTGTVTLTPMPEYVAARLRLSDVRDLAPAVARCRRLLDLDADPVAIDATLGEDPALTTAVAKEPGVRAPRAVDGFEVAVRAIVGQQISVAGARKVLARLVTGADQGDVVADERSNHDNNSMIDAKRGDGLVPFPSAGRVLDLPDDAFAMPAARRGTIRTLAAAVASGELALDPGADRAEAERMLTTLPGVGAWTAGYIALRALGDPDVFLATDLGVRRGAAALGLPDDARTLDDHSERWRPWRSYALMRLWRHA
ncbi:MAG TPA: AlkA N-terminal domain-containing protein [Micromonosporaceae bacterium]|jgi:AraC family transcriptional regulator of adaptative response / DNA-3-methyladenine glycosylase II